MYTILRGSREMPARLCVALGFFDGVHRGHAALLSRVQAQARELEASPAAITFDRHPAAFCGQVPPPLLSAPQDRAFLAERVCGISRTLCLPFDYSVAAMSPEDFVDRVICGELKAVGVTVGANYTFGAGGRGDAALMERLCRARNLAFSLVAPVTEEDAPVSSTRVRNCLAIGDMESAERLLGHPHMMTGLVGHGQRVGRRMHFPTANLQLDDKIALPLAGVYATVTELADGSRYPSVTNIGTRPTVDSREDITIETHLIDTAAELYGAEIRIWFKKYLRPVMKFADLSELAAQISKDVAKAKALGV
ncbi:MAG: riboflavin biosynthesis protein RibF [Clostridia bacterium]|nr:riboflavin biosynthesis protein RibF [Clostridia bacterium]